MLLVIATNLLWIAFSPKTCSLITLFPLPFMAITAANKIINDKYVKSDYYLIKTGNLLLHQVIVINLSDECPISDSS